MKRMNYMNRESARANDAFTERIIGLAIAVHKELGPGFLESVYHRALVIELEDAGVDFESGVPLEITYKGKPAGLFVADIVIEKRLLLELKAVDFVLVAHELQVVNYLKATGLKVGLILNFGGSSLQVKRKHREQLSAPDDLRLQEV